MNTQINLKARRLIFSPTFVTLLMAVVGMLILGGPSVQAQTAAAAVDSSITIPTNATISDPSGSILVTGDVVIRCKQVIDTTTTTAAPLVMLDFDFSQLKGTTGSGKTLRTYITGGNHATELRPFQASDQIIVTVPYFDSTKDALSSSTFMVTANLNFDIATRKLTGGTLTYGTNVFSSSGVGTFTVN